MASIDTGSAPTAVSVDQRKALRLLQDVLAALGPEFARATDRDVRVFKVGAGRHAGTLLLRADGDGEPLWFCRDRDSGEPIALRASDTGETEVGGIDNGCIRWGEVIVARMPSPSVN